MLWVRIGFNAYPDPAFLVNADPDLDPGFWCPQNWRKKIYSRPKWMWIHADPDPQHWFKLYRFISSVFGIQVFVVFPYWYIDEIPLKFFIKTFFCLLFYGVGKIKSLWQFFFYWTSLWIWWKIPEPGVRGLQQDMYSQVLIFQVHLVCSIDHINGPLIWDQFKLARQVLLDVLFCWTWKW